MLELKTEVFASNQSLLPPIPFGIERAKVYFFSSADRVIQSKKGSFLGFWVMTQECNVAFDPIFRYDYTVFLAFLAIFLKY